MNTERLRSLVIITAGCIIYAISFDWFYAPNNLTCGGFTGIAQIINHYIPALPVGIMLIVLNAPLFLLGFKIFGFGFLMKSLYAMTLSSILVDAFANIPYFGPMDNLLASLYGGVIFGFGCGLITREESNTGGTELAAWLLKRRIPHLSFGNLILFLDLTVILLYALAFQNLNNALYGGVALFVTTKVLDLVVYGGNTGKLAHIISAKEAEITNTLLAQGIGISKLSASGAFSRADRPILLCAVRRREIAMVKRIVEEIDPEAFFIISDASEVLGKGFGEYNPNGV